MLIKQLYCCYPINVKVLTLVATVPILFCTMDILHQKFKDVLIEEPQYDNEFNICLSPVLSVEIQCGWHFAFFYILFNRKKIFFQFTIQCCF